MKKHIRLTGAGSDLTACGSFVKWIIDSGDLTAHVPYGATDDDIKKIFTCEKCLALWFEDE